MIAGVVFITQFCLCSYDYFVPLLLALHFNTLQKPLPRRPEALNIKALKKT